MRYVIAILMLVSACGYSSDPEPTVSFYQPLEEQDVPDIEILSPLDSQTTPQQPNSIQDSLNLSPGVWPFRWSGIDEADSYTLFVYDFTGIPTRERETWSTYVELPINGTSTEVELSGEPYLGMSPRLYYFEVAAFDGIELVGKSDAWAIAVPPN